MKQALIVAVDEDYGIGKDGQIPWHYPKDLKRFKALTKGNLCVMGRKSYVDIYNFATSKGWAVLPERNLVVLSRQHAKKAYPRDIPLYDTHEKHPLEGRVYIMNEMGMVYHYIVTHAFDREIFEFGEDDMVFYCGGTAIYEAAMLFGIDEAYITYVPGTHDCDAHFRGVELIERVFDLVEDEKDEETGLRFTKYVKRTAVQLYGEDYEY